jgi:hypothetical protein
MRVVLVASQLIAHSQKEAIAIRRDFHQPIPLLSHSAEEGLLIRLKRLKAVLHASSRFLPRTQRSIVALVAQPPHT